MKHIFLAILITSVALIGADLNESYNLGNTCYKEGNYSGAIESYLSSVNKGGCDWRIYYNLGNSYYRNGEIGEAVLAYERGLFLDPRNEDILNNLDFVRKTEVDILLDTDNRGKIRDIYENTPIGVFYDILAKISFKELIIICAIWTILATISLFFLLVLKSRITVVLKVLTIAFWALALAIMVPYSLKKFYIWETSKAIILVPKVELRSEPSSSSQLKYTLKEGMEVAVKETRGDFSRVFLRNGEDGWLRHISIERVVPER